MINYDEKISFAQELDGRVHFGEVALKAVEDAIKGIETAESAEIIDALKAGKVTIAELKDIAKRDREYQAFLEREEQEKFERWEALHEYLSEYYVNIGDEFWRNKKTGKIVDASLMW